MISTEYHKWDFYSTMLDYKTFKIKNCNNLSEYKSQKMYDMYIGGEAEVATGKKLTMEDVMEAKKMLVKAKVPSGNLVAYCDSTAVAAFGCCTTASTPVRPSVIAWFDDCECEKQEGKTPMTINTERDYLARRLNEVSYETIRGLQKTYNIGVYTGPRTYKELIDFITNNKYTLDTKRTAVVDAETVDNEFWSVSFTDGIVWNGRGVEDRKTYDLATKALEDARITARDVIMTSDATAGLAALNTFKTWTYTAPTVTA